MKKSLEEAEVGSGMRRDGMAFSVQLFFFPSG